MSFMPSNQSQRTTEGNPEAKIWIVGDCPDGYALREHRPFAGPQETVLQNCLHQAGLIKHQVFLTNLVYDRKDRDKIWRSAGHKGPSQLKQSVKPYVDELAALAAERRPEVVVALGELTAFSLIKRSGITRIRGYPFFSEGQGIKVIPSLHPADMIRFNYIWRHYLAHDLIKARKVADDPSLLLPPTTIVIPDTFNDAMHWLDYFANKSGVAADIEVANFQTSCIGFADKPCHGVSIPTDDRWSELEEVHIWRGIARILEDPAIVKCGQNWIFDAHFLAKTMGIFSTGYKPGEPKLIDTMMAHSIMYPDFSKGLEFLGGTYTYHPYWKDELHIKTIKDES